MDTVSALREAPRVWIIGDAESQLCSSIGDSLGCFVQIQEPASVGWILNGGESGGLNPDRMGEFVGVTVVSGRKPDVRGLLS